VRVQTATDALSGTYSHFGFGQIFEQATFRPSGGVCPPGVVTNHPSLQHHPVPSWAQESLSLQITEAWLTWGNKYAWGLPQKARRLPRTVIRISGFFFPFRYFDRLSVIA